VLMEHLKLQQFLIALVARLFCWIIGKVGIHWISLGISCRKSHVSQQQKSSSKHQIKSRLHAAKN
jgi:hypothetical protein